MCFPIQTVVFLPLRLPDFFRGGLSSISQSSSRSSSSSSVDCFCKCDPIAACDCVALIWSSSGFLQFPFACSHSRNVSRNSFRSTRPSLLMSIILHISRSCSLVSCSGRCFLRSSQASANSSSEMKPISRILLLTSLIIMYDFTRVIFIENAEDHFQAAFVLVQ